MAKGGSGLAAPVWKARRSSLNSGVPWLTPETAEARVLGIQRKLHKWAKDDQARRFKDLHNLVCATRGSASSGGASSATWDVEAAPASSCSHAERPCGRSWTRSRRSPKAAPTRRSTSCSPGSTRCCAAGAPTSARDSRRGRSSTSATTLGSGWFTGCYVNTRNETGAVFGNITYPGGGRPGARPRSITRPRLAP